MQTGHHISARWVAAGYGTSVISFVIMAVFLVDVLNVTTSEPFSTTLGSYNSNATYLFPIGYWYEFAIVMTALVAGFVLAAATFYRRRGSSFAPIT